MQKTIYTFIFIIFFTSFIYAQIGINTTAPTVSLEVNGEPTNAEVLDGIIPPRLTGEQLRAKTYNKEHTGAFVYVTAADPNPQGQTIHVTSPGFYYFDGTVWVGVHKNREASQCVQEPFSKGDNGTTLTVGNYSFQWYTNSDNSYMNNNIKIKKNTPGNVYAISKSSGGADFDLGVSFREVKSNEWINIGDNLNVDTDQVGEIVIHTESNDVFKIVASGIKRTADTPAQYCYFIEQIH